jgi:cyclase
MPVMLWDKFGLVKGQQFKADRRIGSVIPMIRVYNARDVDELVLLDIDATKSNLVPRFSEVALFSKECSVPLTVGGGITSLSHIEELLKSGADKIVINSAAYRDIELVRKAANHFGSQCIVSGIDFSVIDGVARCVSRCGSEMLDIEAINWAKIVADAGAGEILLTSVQRDGMLCGLDLGVIKSVTEVVSVPVIASGGTRDYKDMADAILISRTAAIGAASIFHFTEQTPSGARDYLRDCGIPTRMSLK